MMILHTINQPLLKEAAVPALTCRYLPIILPLSYCVNKIIKDYRICRYSFFFCHFPELNKRFVCNMLTQLKGYIHFIQQLYSQTTELLLAIGKPREALAAFEAALALAPDRAGALRGKAEAERHISR